MRLAIANNYLSLRGGAERVMIDEMLLLRQNGVEVSAFGRFQPGCEQHPHFELFPPMIEWERVRGLERICLAARMISNSESRVLFGKYLDRVKPNIAHGHNIYGGLTFSIVDAAKERGIPFLLTLHDFKLVCPSYLMLNHGDICERCLGGRFWNCTVQRCHKDRLAPSLVYTIESYFNSVFKRYDWISKYLCPSRFILEKCAQGGLPREKMVFLPNAINPDAFCPSYESGRYVLFSGRLSKEKGIFTLLEAIRGLDIPLRIAGTGPMEAEAKAYVTRNGMTNVVFEGFCSGTQLQDLYRQAAFLVIPSEWYENAPMSVLEAFAYGKPVVGSNMGGIPELVILGETGFLFESGDVNELRALLCKVWSEKGKLGPKLGRNARARIENEFSAKRHVEALLNIYNECLTTHQ